MSTKVSSCREYFDKIQDRFVAEGAKGIDATFLFDLGGDGGGQWTVHIKDGTCSVEEGKTVDKPKVTYIMKAGDYVDMANGQLDGRKAYFTRKLKVKGSIPMAQKMKNFLPPSE
jgi:putative sterol carrier protein